MRYVGGTSARLRVRASYRLRNIGNNQLSFVEAALPDPRAGRENVRAWVEGREVPLSAGDGEAQPLRVPFNPSWAQKQRRGFVLEYELAPAPPGDATLAVNQAAFHLRGADAFPELRPPKGTFAKGGKAPADFFLVVRVPEDFRVFVLGRARGSHRQAGESEHRYTVFRSDFPLLVAAGRYQEQQVQTPGGGVVFWTFDALPAGPAQTAAARLGASFASYRAAFGPIWKKLPLVRLIETPARLPRPPGAVGDAAGIPLPAGALLNSPAFAAGVSSDVFLELAERELSLTWFALRVTPRAETEPALGEGLAEYAVVVAGEARGGEAERRRRAAALLDRFDRLTQRASEKPLLRLEPTDSDEQRAMGTAKAALFFLALEERYGKETVRRALANLVSSLAGREFAFGEVLSAIELESHEKAGEFFRQWLDRTGVPAEVRARYAAGAGRQ